MKSIINPSCSELNLIDMSESVKKIETKVNELSHQIEEQKINNIQTMHERVSYSGVLKSGKNLDADIVTTRKINNYSQT